MYYNESIFTQIVQMYYDSESIFTQIVQMYYDGIFTQILQMYYDSIFTQIVQMYYYIHTRLCKCIMIYIHRNSAYSQNNTNVLWQYIHTNCANVL